MYNLEVSYLGLKLKNPVIVSSSGLTSSVEKIKKIEKSGAGAVVLKSLFEEQINYEAGSLIMNHDYPEAEDYIRNYTKDHGVGEYLKLIEEAKKAVSIPVIASINCISANDWVRFTREIEKAGADAIELNVFSLPTDKNLEASEYEKVYFELAGKIKSVTNLPVSMKIGNHFTNPVNMVYKLFTLGIKGVVLFNRFYEPDIDINKFSLTAAEVFSTPSEIRQNLRWVAIISDKVNQIDISASTGIHSGEAIIKQLLAGAEAVQVCSVLYKNGVEYIDKMLDEVEDWMKNNNFKSIQEFRGKMSYKSIPDPMLYERSQFMKYFSSVH
jgi:dihydroorotate dehydrogenase (fumarate)